MSDFFTDLRIRLDADEYQKLNRLAEPLGLNHANYVRSVLGLAFRYRGQNKEANFGHTRSHAHIRRLRESRTYCAKPTGDIPQERLVEADEAPELIATKGALCASCKARFTLEGKRA